MLGNILSTQPASDSSLGLRTEAQPHPTPPPPPAVTRFNLECLGLCPCLVDIEIMDTRNGNEVQLVTAGHAACACDSPARKVGGGGSIVEGWFCSREVVQGEGLPAENVVLELEQKAGGRSAQR